MRHFTVAALCCAILAACGGEESTTPRAASPEQPSEPSRAPAAAPVSAPASSSATSAAPISGDRLFPGAVPAPARGCTDSAPCTPGTPGCDAQGHKIGAEAECLPPGKAP